MKIRNRDYAVILSKRRIPGGPSAFGLRTSLRDGYVAIISALIITAIIVVMMIGLGQVAYLNRANVSEAHFKEKSRALSEACVNTALLRLVSSSSYAGDETIAVASDTCQIVAVVSSSTGRIITTQGQFQQSYTNLRVTVETSTVSVTGWEETQQ